MVRKTGTKTMGSGCARGDLTRGEGADCGAGYFGRHAASEPFYL
jgi:hypothetical protein